MGPAMLSAIMAGAGGLNEMTTGRETQTRQAANKANAYRMMAYSKRINPDDIDIREADPMNAMMQGGISGYQLGSGIARDQAGNAPGKGVDMGDGKSVDQMLAEEPQLEEPELGSSLYRQAGRRSLKMDL